jgi:mannose-6-phosphate isomerase-like protein (cupin superfamily)
MATDSTASPPGGASGGASGERGAGRTGLVRRTVSVTAGTRFDGVTGAGGELWFVITGRGLLASQEPGDHWQEAPVDRDTGLWLPPGISYRLSADQQEEIVLDAVALPARPSVIPGPVRISELGDCEVEHTGDRRFRVLLGPGRGCEVATQFVGEIPPGRAPEHTHTYDELVLVLQGQGVAHTRPSGAAAGETPADVGTSDVGSSGDTTADAGTANGDTADLDTADGGTADRDTADLVLAPGRRVHLPPGLPHCLENTGPGTLVVLGVFHPGGSPAAKTQSPRTADQAPTG